MFLKTLEIRQNLFTVDITINGKKKETHTCQISKSQKSQKRIKTQQHWHHMQRVCAIPPKVQNWVIQLMLKIVCLKQVTIQHWNITIGHL